MIPFMGAIRPITLIHDQQLIRKFIEPNQLAGASNGGLRLILRNKPSVVVRKFSSFLARVRRENFRTKTTLES